MRIEAGTHKLGRVGNDVIRHVAGHVGANRERAQALGAAPGGVGVLGGVRGQVPTPARCGSSCGWPQSAGFSRARPDHHQTCLSTPSTAP